MIRFLSVLTLLAIPAVAMAEEKQLFNGKDLTGWEGRKDLWSVEDGAITGRTVADKPIKNNTFLVWSGEVADFELTFQYRIVAGNSGMQYRSKVVSQNDETGPIVGGYQADFEAGKTYSGINYEERGRGILAARGERTKLTADPSDKNKMVKTVTAKTEKTTEELQAAIKNEEWNTYRIVAKGNTLQHYINGNLTSEVVDEHAEKSTAKGKLALQLHAGPAMVVQMKDVVLKTAD
ncbi:MAG: DUF1080 domain-containing protein [Planctomycetota bacterium]|nr:MAG: DUF1080 domain-containing protein [Planctomycetota bacterium]